MVQVRCIVWLCCVVPATLHLPISPKLVASLTKYRNSGFDFTSDVVNSLSEFTPSPVACSSVYRLCHHYCATYTTSQPDKLACKITHTSSKTYILKSRCICSKAFSEQEQDRLAQCKDTPLPVYTFDGKHVENGGLTDEELYPKAMFNTDFEELGGTSLTPEDFARGAAMADKNRSDSADSELQAGQFQGDIVMPEGNDEKNMKATLAAAASNLWIGGIVPYTISNYVTNAHRAAIAGAIAYIQNRTCIRFKEREKEGDWIHYYAGTGCSSSVGRTGGPQFISLSRRCITSIGTPIHETMHALGFFHQQSRPDRDRYVTIVWNNITSFACLQFQKVPQEYYGTTYDYGSVMHYKTNSFGQRVRGVKKTTIRPTRPEAEDAEIGQRNHASKGDITRLCRKYNCGSNCYPDP